MRFKVKQSRLIYTFYGVSCLELDHGPLVLMTRLRTIPRCAGICLCSLPRFADICLPIFSSRRSAKVGLHINNQRLGVIPFVLFWNFSGQNSKKFYNKKQRALLKSTTDIYERSVESASGLA